MPGIATIGRSLRDDDFDVASLLSSPPSPIADTLAPPFVSFLSALDFFGNPLTALSLFLSLSVKLIYSGFTVVCFEKRGETWRVSCIDILGRCDRIFNKNLDHICKYNIGRETY